MWEPGNKIIKEYLGNKMWLYTTVKGIEITYMEVRCKRCKYGTFDEFVVEKLDYSRFWPSDYEKLKVLFFFDVEDCVCHNNPNIKKDVSDY